MIPPSEEELKEQLRVLKQICYGYPATRQAPLLIKGRNIVEDHSFQNACDMMRSGAAVIFDNYCDACYGAGRIKGERCWHCEGDGVDPTK